MIEFKDNDFKMVEIKRESKLFNLVTEYKYFVYGLCMTENPPILIEYHFDKVDEHFEEKLEALTEFFKANNIDIETYNKSDNKGRIDIGLRRDLRSVVNKNGKPMLASSIISTIVYTLEGRVDIDQLKKYKLSTLPKLQKTARVEQHVNNTGQNPSPSHA
jgi:hypothetical protein